MNKLSQVAAMVKRAGAAGSPDTVLAHITPREAALLKARGGSGRIDPKTGLPHFDDSSDSSSDSSDSGGYSSSWSSAGGGYSSPFSGMGSAPAYSGFGEGYTPATTDPTYNAKGYYSAAGGYPGGEDDDANPTRYYSDRRTIGGEIANYFGADPEGWGATLGNVGVSALGSINPFMNLAGKAIQAAVGAQSDPHLADSEGNGGSLNAMGRLAAGDSDTLAAALSNIRQFQAAPNDAQGEARQVAQSDQAQQIASNSVASAYSDLLKRRRQQA